MSVASFACILAVVLAAGLLFFHLFSLISFGEFEQNIVSKEDLCTTVNPVALPEHIAPIFLAALFLLTFQWLPLLVIAPMAAYNIKKLRTKTHILAVTELKFRRVPAWRRREAWSKLGFYIVAFFVYLYWLLVAFLDDSS
ncbi:cornichon [Mycena filopes]|nr:cornichon [Mycena filopes]